jgi:hypothetical protein
MAKDALKSNERTTPLRLRNSLSWCSEHVYRARLRRSSPDIERRRDGPVWIILENFHTGDAADLRLDLKEDALLQHAEGFWGTAEGGYEIAMINHSDATQDIEVPGAWDMAGIQPLTVMDCTPPDFPAPRSVALD